MEKNTEVKERQDCAAELGACKTTHDIEYNDTLDVCLMMELEL